MELQHGNRTAPGAVAKRIKNSSGGKSVVVLKKGDVTIRNKIVYMPNTIEMAQLKKPGKGQFWRQVPIDSGMTAEQIEKLLKECFPCLEGKSFYCAAAVDNRTKLDFDGSPCIWDGSFIKRKIKGNSALYIFAEESGRPSIFDSHTCISERAAPIWSQGQCVSQGSGDLVQPIGMGSLEPEIQGPPITGLLSNYFVYSSVAPAMTSEVNQEFLFLSETNSSPQDENPLNGRPHTGTHSTTSCLCPNNASQMFPTLSDSWHQELSELDSANVPSSDVDSGWQDDGNGLPCDRDLVSSDLDRILQLFGDQDFTLSSMNIVDGQSSMEIQPEGTAHQDQVGADCNGNSPTEEFDSLTTATDLNIKSRNSSQECDLDHSVVQRIIPPSGSVEGGYPFVIALSEPLPGQVNFGEAKFHGVATVNLEKLNNHTFSGTVPRCHLAEPGIVEVTVMTQTGQHLGTTSFEYVDELTKIAKEITVDHGKQAKFFSKLSEEHKVLSGSSLQSKQQHSLQFLQFLVYTASQTGAKKFIEIIFSTSAGQIVFDSYKDRTCLPEDVARASGHDELANYLQDLTTRFSKEPEFSRKEAHVIDWSELEAAAIAAQTQGCLTEEKSSDDSSENNSDTDYFADVETSSIDSSELSRSTSEDDTSEPNSRDKTKASAHQSITSIGKWAFAGNGTMGKIGQIKEGMKQKSCVLILRDSHFDSSLPEVVKGLDYTLAFHLAIGSKNIPCHLHTVNERFLVLRESITRQPTMSFCKLHPYPDVLKESSLVKNNKGLISNTAASKQRHWNQLNEDIVAELGTLMPIEKDIAVEWKSSGTFGKEFGAHTHCDLWVFTSAFRPTRKTFFVYFADRRNALPHSYFFEDEDCESQVRCWKWKRSENNSLKFTESLKENKLPPGREKSQMESDVDLPVTYIVRDKQAETPSESGICLSWMHAMMHHCWTTESTEKASNITIFDRFLGVLECAGSHMDQDLDKDRMLSTEIQELLVDSVPAAAGGGNISFHNVEELLHERRGLSLSPFRSEYLQLCQNLHCDDLTLDCSAESEKSLFQVIKEVRLSGETTQLDLSRRCFTSKKELLEVCKSAKMLKRLILQDISFVNDNDESDQGIALIKLIRWYCPTLHEVDTTGCSDVTLNALFTSENDILKDTGICASMKGDVTVVDLLKTNPDLKECLMPSSRASNLSNLSSRIEAFVRRGVPVNITYDGWSFLHTASAIGDAKLVSWLLENRRTNKVQFVASRRPTALDIAIYRQDATIVKLLLNVHKTYDYDPVKFVNLCILSQISPEVCTALQGDVGKSCVCNPLEVVILITAGMSLEYKKSFVLEICKALERMPPGEFCQKKCWIEEILVYLLKKLVESGGSPDISIKELNGKTPLMCVAKSFVLVKTLLDLGASSNIKDRDGNTALFYVAKIASLQGTDEHLKTLQLIIESGVDVNLRNHSGDTPLLHTVSTDRSKGQTGLYEEIAREHSMIKTWRLLIEAGADVAARNHRRQSVMHLIAENIKSRLHKLQNNSTETRVGEITEILINESERQIGFISDCIKDVKSRDDEGNTPLHVLAGYDSVHHGGMVRIAETLITNGSKGNIANDDDKTPLEQGAKPVLDNKQQSPLILRCFLSVTLEPLNKLSDGMNFGMGPLLVIYSRNTFTGLMKNAKFSDLHSFVQGSIDKDSGTIFIRDSKDNILLHRLCNYNDLRVRPSVDLLLQTGADVNKQNEDCDSPLHICCRRFLRMLSPKGENAVPGKFIIPSLLGYGADSRLKNKRGCSVLDIARWMTNPLRKFQRPRKQKQPEPFIPWNPVSRCHRDKLSQVARRRNVQKVDEFFFHEDPISSGTFGVVYVAINKDDVRETALRSHQMDREVESLVHLPSCFQVVKYLVTWTVQELREGDLDELLQETFDKNCLPNLCNDVLTGVNYLHENKLLHRDLKPSNVLYTYFGGRPCLKISDFGLSKNLGAEMWLGTSVFHSRAGSRCWMAPELLQSTRPFVHSFASDIFVTGHILHYLLAKGHYPLEGSNPIQNSPIGAIEQSILNNSTSLSPDVTDEAKDLVVQLLSANRDDRPKASEALKHPYFWSNGRKIQFLTAMGNQKEIGTYTPLGATAVERQFVQSFFPGSNWASLFTAVYNEMTSSAKGRLYTTSSALHLICFIGNAYARASDSSRTSGFQAALLNDYIFFRKISNLVLIAFKAVKSGKWDLRREISKVLDVD